MGRDQKPQSQHLVENRVTPTPSPFSDTKDGKEYTGIFQELFGDPSPYSVHLGICVSLFAKKFGFKGPKHTFWEV